MGDDHQVEAKNEVVRHLLASLSYRLTKALYEAPDNFSNISIGQGVKTPEKILSHINMLLQLSNRFWSHIRPPTLPERRKRLVNKGWEGEIEFFYALIEELDKIIQTYPVPRQHNPEKILQGPLMDAYTHVGQLAIIRRMSGSPIPSESYANAEITIGHLGPDQKLQKP